MAYSKKKRFIAGAVCPKCSAMDKLMVYNLDDKDWRECVACDYKEEMRFKPQPRALETRVNVSEEEEKQVVQILDFPPKSH